MRCWEKLNSFYKFCSYFFRFSFDLFYVSCSGRTWLTLWSMSYVPYPLWSESCFSLLEHYEIPHSIVHIQIFARAPLVESQSGSSQSLAFARALVFISFFLLESWDDPAKLYWILLGSRRLLGFWLRSPWICFSLYNPCLRFSRGRCIVS